MTKLPVRLWRYALPNENHEGWAIIVLGSDGFFAAVSDYGNYAFNWPHHGCDDFRQFFLRCGPEYLRGKLGERYLNPQKSFDEVKREILGQRRHGGRQPDPFTLSHPARAREAWDHVAYYASDDDWDGFLRDSETHKYFDEPWNWGVTEYSPQVRVFTETTICKRLRALIAAEFAERCPKCDSPQPHLHPAVQYGGEVQPCSHPFHLRVTPENTPERIAEVKP